MIRKIIVPLDGSTLAEQALPYAESIAQAFKADLTLVWVLHPLIFISDFGATAYETIIHLERQEAETYLTLLQLRLQRTLSKVAWVVLEGHPAEAIIDLACRDQAGLIIMSTHGRSGLSRWTHGSMTAQVIKHAPCPILQVRAK